MGVLSSYIFSTLIQKPDHLPFKTFGQLVQLVDDGTLHLVDRHADAIFYGLLGNSSGNEAEFFEAAVEKNPIRIGESIEEVLDLLDSKGAVMINYVSKTFLLEIVKIKI